MRKHVTDMFMQITLSMRLRMKGLALLAALGTPRG